MDLREGLERFEEKGGLVKERVDSREGLRDVGGVLWRLILGVDLRSGGLGSWGATIREWKNEERGKQ